MNDVKYTPESRNAVQAAMARMAMEGRLRAFACLVKICPRCSKNCTRNPSALCQLFGKPEVVQCESSWGTQGRQDVYVYFRRQTL
jgi:hypothetical protein